MLVTLGGKGSGNFSHAGRPGEVGGSRPALNVQDHLARMVRGERWAPPATPEEEKQARLALANDQPNARPLIVMGMDNGSEAYRYVGAYGQAFDAVDPRPDDIPKGTPNECYANASKVLMRRPDLTYAEGWASTAKTPGIFFMHGWLVNAQNEVIDPTWDDGVEYFGVKYDRTAYLKHLYKAKYYGVVGADLKTARKAMQSGAYDLRSAAVKARSLAEFRACIIRKVGDKWVLFTRDGSRRLGTHDTRAQAEAQEKAIEISKHRAAGGAGSGNFGHAGRPGAIGGSAPRAFEHGDIQVGSLRQGKNFAEARVSAPASITAPDNWALINDPDKTEAIVRGLRKDGKAPNRHDPVWSTWSKRDEVLARGQTYAEAVAHAKRHVLSSQDPIDEPGVWPVDEAAHEQALRRSRGYTEVVRVDAREFQDRYERSQRQTLVWNRNRLDALRPVARLDAYPQVVAEGSGDDLRVDVTDGRHRLGLAAEREQQLDVAMTPESARAFRARK